MNNSQKLVVVVGAPLSGKSTFAKALDNFQPQSFAGPLYQVLEIICGRNEIAEAREYNRKDAPMAALQGKTIREALQTLGTEWGRETIGSDVWVDHLFNRCSGTPNVVIDDLRFPNEYEECAKRGAVFVRMVDLNATGEDVGGGISGHSSESHQEKFKAHVVCEWIDRQDIFDFAASLDLADFEGIDPKL